MIYYFIKAALRNPDQEVGPISQQPYKHIKKQPYHHDTQFSGHNKIISDRSKNRQFIGCFKESYCKNRLKSVVLDSIVLPALHL